MNVETRPSNESTRDNPELIAAIAAYDEALASDDLDTVDSFFDDHPDTSRFDASGPVRGPNAISDMRRLRPPGTVSGRVVHSHIVRSLDHHTAVATMEFTTATGTRMLRTQVWVRRIGNWRIAHAHLSCF